MGISKKKEQRVNHDLKYMQDLIDEFSSYVNHLIINIYEGSLKNLGISNISKLQKARSFFSKLRFVGAKLQGYIGRRIKQTPLEPFKIKKYKLFEKGKPLSNQEWNNFEKQVMDYMQPYINGLSEELAVKGIMLAMASNEMEQTGKTVKQYGKKSYTQLEKDMFVGYVPDTMRSVQERYAIDKEIEKTIALSQIQIGDYITQSSQDVTNSIKQQVLTAHRLNKTPQELASDLFWQKEDKPELKKYTSEIQMRNWNRVAETELAIIHEKGKMAQNEVQAKQSIEDPSKAVYLVFAGTGVCDWCSPRQGEIVRQLPVNAVQNERDDKLSSRGIDDPYTNTAVWVGKNNVGYKQKDWRLASPSHPRCNCSFSRIYPDKQEYDKKNKRIRYKGGAEFEKFIPGEFLEELATEQAKRQLRQDLLIKERAKSLLDYEQQQIK